MIIDCIADLHGFTPELDKGDLLIVAGDLTSRDEAHQHFTMWNWLSNQNYKKIVVIAGNHDRFIESFDGEHVITHWSKNLTYLCDSGTEFQGLKIFGSPWTKTFPELNPHCQAFTLDTEDEMMNKFEKIPHDTDILITHSPPWGVLDQTIQGLSVGSPSLFSWLKYVERPKLHVFGHVHEAYGKMECFMSYDNKMMISVNASYVNELYQPVNKPVRIIL
jgi:Icc-related predicted phosphoesterase